MNIDGKKISEARKLKGLSQEKLADLAKVNLRTIQRIENNQSEPHGNTLNLICDVLEIDIEDLILNNDTDNPNFFYGYKLAPKWKRLFANLVEFIIYFSIIGMPIIIYKIITEHADLQNFTIIKIQYSTFFSLMIGAIFYPMFTGNLGHKIFNLKVICSETGEDYNKAADGAIREFLKWMMSYLFIPIIWILWDKKNQNLYDKFTKTYVVEKTI